MGYTAVLCGAHKRHFISVAVIVPVKGKFSTTVPISGGVRRGEAGRGRWSLYYNTAAPTAVCYSDTERCDSLTGLANPFIGIFG